MGRLGADDFGENTFCIAELAETHLANPDGHQACRARVILKRRPSLPDFGNDILRGGIAGNPLKLGKQAVQIRVALVRGGMELGDADDIVFARTNSKQAASLARKSIC